MALRDLTKLSLNLRPGYDVGTGVTGFKDIKLDLDNVATQLKAISDDLTVFDGGGSTVPNQQTGTTYELTEDDFYLPMVEFSNGSPITVTVPQDLVLPNGKFCNILQTGAGLVTLVGGGTVTINVLSTLGLNSAGQYAMFSVYKQNDNVYNAVGQLSA